MKCPKQKRRQDAKTITKTKKQTLLTREISVLVIQKMEPKLNIMCGICSEFYKANDIVYSTMACGHLFHYNCLNRWLQRNKTCPQCRRNCHKHRIHRVYLNFSEPKTEDDIDIEETGPYWIPITWNSSGEKPKGAIKAGTDDEGNDAYVARAYYREDLLPANFVPKKHGAYAPYGCRAHFLLQDVELLVDCTCKWVPDSNGHVPADAIITGYSETGESLYTGRGKYEGLILPGKVHRSHGVLYMPFKGQEVNVKEYEVLVLVDKNKISGATMDSDCD